MSSKRGTYQFSLSTRHFLVLGSCLFQFFEDLVRTHPAYQQLLQHNLCFNLLCFFGGPSICLCLLRFQGCHFFFGLLQCILLLLNRFLDGCDFSIQRRNSLLLLHNLGCVVVISFWTVFTAFRSGPSDNLFPFIVV